MCYPVFTGEQADVAVDIQIHVEYRGVDALVVMFEARFLLSVRFVSCFLILQSVLDFL